MFNKKRSSGVFVKKPSIVATQVALAVMAQLAYAQAQAQSPERVERVEITGTRLPALNVEGPSPVTVMNAQEIRMDGLSKTEDLLNNLPQVFAAQGTNTSNGATGTAQVNLRNLGVVRNLVLLNGRRLPPGSPFGGSDSYAADLNQIPAPLIQRVEMLTGGASAVYGSDAISGVVNFIMNDRFEGLQIDLQHSFYNHQQQNPSGIGDLVRSRGVTNPAQFQVPDDIGSDGRVRGFSVLMGRNFADNKGNATLFFGYKKEDAVLQKARDFSACALNPGTRFTCGGSSTSATGRFFLGLGATDPGGDVTVADAAGNTRPFSSATDQFNFGPYNYFRRPSEQYNFNAFAHLDVHPRVRAYTELGFHDNYTDAQIAPSGSFFTDQIIHFENPLLSTDWRNQIAAAQVAPFAAAGDTAEMLIGRRNIEGGGRDDQIRHTSYRGVLGAKGALDNVWNYDGFLQRGRVLLQETYRNDFSIQRINKALDVITNPATGQPACRSFVDGTDPNCVPWNIWSIGGVTPAALNYLQTPGLQTGFTDQKVMGFNMAADLAAYGLKLPGARNGIGVVVGVEQRTEWLQLTTDTAFQTGDLAGQGGATGSVPERSLKANEFYTEARVPVFERQAFADLLSFNGSYRHSNYSTGKQTDTYGVGAEWAPVRNYRFRGSYQRAVRHANIIELYEPQTVNLFGLTEDPCGPAMTNTLAQCQRSGITAAQYGSAILDSPAGQYNYLGGGDETLKPERADTYTFGLVFTPVRNLTAAVDFWSIKIADAVQTPPPATILSQCLNNGLLCNLVQRDPATGALWLSGGQVVALRTNLGGFHTQGLDFQAGYTLRVGAVGSVGVNFNGTWMKKFESEPIKDAGKFDCADLYGPNCLGVYPTWRHKARVSWSTPWNVDLAATWRHISEVKHEGTSSNPLLADPSIPATDRTLDARDYFDLAAQWNINKTFSLRAGVNNVLDQDPPIVSQIAADVSFFGNGNTFPQIYDTLGRLVFVNLTMKF